MEKREALFGSCCSLCCWQTLLLLIKHGPWVMTRKWLVPKQEMTSSKLAWCRWTSFGCSWCFFGWGVCPWGRLGWVVGTEFIERHWSGLMSSPTPLILIVICNLTCHPFEKHLPAEGAFTFCSFLSCGEGRLCLPYNWLVFMCVFVYIYVYMRVCGCGCVWKNVCVSVHAGVCIFVKEVRKKERKKEWTSESVRTPLIIQKVSPSPTRLIHTANEAE